MIAQALPYPRRSPTASSVLLAFEALSRLTRSCGLGVVVASGLAFGQVFEVANTEMARVGDPERPLAPPSTVGPAIGGRAAPSAPTPSRTLPRLDPRQARARQARLPPEVLRGEPVDERQPPATPVAVEAPVTQRLEPPTELVVEAPSNSSGPELLVDTQWALPPTLTAERAPREPPSPAVHVPAFEPSECTNPPRSVGPQGLAPKRSPGQDLESVFIKRAEVALERGGCGRFLVGLEDIAQDDTRSPKSEQARVLRARCFDLELRPRQASNEYRKYLEEYPRGRHVLEAKEALGAP